MSNLPLPVGNVSVQPIAVLDYQSTLKDIEKYVMERYITYYKWNIVATCRALGISRPTLYSKMRRHNIRRPK